MTRISTCCVVTSTLAVVGTIAVLGLAASAVAQVYPSRPITMIVPFAAGGPTDAVAHVIPTHEPFTLERTLLSRMSPERPAASVSAVSRTPRATATRFCSACGARTSSTARSTIYHTICRRTSSRLRCCRTTRCLSSATMPFQRRA